MIIYFNLPHGLKDLVFTSCQYIDTLPYMSQGTGIWTVADAIEQILKNK